MKRIQRIIFNLFLISFILYSCKSGQDSYEKHLWEKAQNICKTNLILDAHIDWPEKHIEYTGDITKLKSKCDFDLIRAKKGGLNTVLSVAYIPSELNEKVESKVKDIESEIFSSDMFRSWRKYYLSSPKDQYARSSAAGGEDRDFLIKCANAL